MKVLFDTRLYVYDKYLEIIAEKCELTILERYDLINKGGIKKAQSLSIVEWGRGFSKLLSAFGLQISLPNIIKSYNSIVSKVDPDVIVVNDLFHISSFQALLYKKRGRRVKIIVCSEIKKWPKHWLAKIFMQACFYVWRKNSSHILKIITYTNDGKNFLTQQLPCIPNVVIAPIIDTEELPVYKERLFLPEGTLRIIMNARFFSYKRHEILLRSLSALSKSGHAFKLTLVSRENQGVSNIEKMVEAFDLGDRVVFNPAVDKAGLVELMKNQDVLVLPSYNEAIGMVVPEAMALGVPTITSDTVGANVYVQNGITGLVFKTDDTEDLFRCLRECYDTERLINMSENGVRRITKEYSMKSHGDRLAREII